MMIRRNGHFGPVQKHCSAGLRSPVASCNTFAKCGQAARGRRV